MPKDRDDEQRAFLEAMSGARPLPGPRLVVGPARVSRTGGHPAVPRRPRSVVPAAVTGDGASGRAPDVSARDLRALRTGDRRPEARLDLHGMTRDEALGAAERFIQQCRAGGIRAVAIIHGRGRNSQDGTPVLRPALHAWLSGAAATRAGVMAFAPAPPRSGGAGATVILLRR